MFDRRDVHAVGGNDRERAGGGAEIEIGGGGGVDDAEADGLAGADEGAGLALAVEEKGVVGDVGNIHREKAGLFAFEVVAEVAGAEGAENRLGGVFANRIPVAAAEEGAHDVAGVFVGPIGEDDDEVLIDAGQVGAGRSAGGGFDDDAAVDAALFLEAGVAVIPVGAGVFQEEFEGALGAGGDGRGGEVGDAVFEIGQEQTVPMEGRLAGREAVADDDAGDVADAEAERGTGDGAVNREGGDGATGGSEIGLGDVEGVSGDGRVGKERGGFGGEFAGEPAGFAFAAAVGTGVSGGGGDQCEDGEEQRSQGRGDTRRLGRTEGHHEKLEIHEIRKK